MWKLYQNMLKCFSEFIVKCVTCEVFTDIKQGCCTLLFLLGVLFATSALAHQNHSKNAQEQDNQIYPLWPFAQILTDPDRALDVTQVLSHPDFEPLNGHPQLGQSRKQFWFRIQFDETILAATSKPALFLKSAIIDHIQLYQVKADESAELLVDSGDEHTYFDRQIPSRFFIFPLGTVTSNQVYFLSVWSKSPLVIPAYVGSMEAIRINEERNDAVAISLMSITLAMLLIMIVWALRERDAVIALGAVYIAALLGYTLVISGLGYQFLWSHSAFVQNSIAYIFVATLLFALMQLTLNVLPRSELDRRVERFVWHFSFVPFYCLMTLPFSTSLAFELLRNLTFMVAVIAILVTFKRAKNYRPVRFLLAALSVMLIGALLHNLNYVGVISVNWLSSHSVEFMGSIQSLLLLALFCSRIREQEQSEHERYERELDQKEQQLLALESKLALAVSRSEAKNTFLSNLSLRAKGPMNDFYANIELLASDNLTDSQMEKLDSAKASAIQLFFVMDNLLTYSDILEDKVVPIESKNDVQSELRELVSSWVKSREISDTHASITFSDNVDGALFAEWEHINKVLKVFFDSLEPLLADRHLVISVDLTKCKNDNALENESILNISIQNLHVPDTRILDNWAKETILASEWEGLGLEYYVGRKLIEVLGARVGYRIDEQDHAKICIDFPCRVAKDSYSTELRSRFPNVHVLVVDDNKVNVQVVSAMLSKLGATTDFAYSGEEALRKSGESDYDLILMDCIMPGISGQETAMRIRQTISSNKNCPIVAVSANSSDKDRESCLQAGMNDFMSKPVRIEKLTKFLTRWVPEY